MWHSDEHATNFDATHEVTHMPSADADLTRQAWIVFSSTWSGAKVLQPSVPCATFGTFPAADDGAATDGGFCCWDLRSWCKSHMPQKAGTLTEVKASCFAAAEHCRLRSCCSASGVESGHTSKCERQSTSSNAFRWLKEQVILMACKCRCMCAGAPV